MIFSQDELSKLEERVGIALSEHRFLHTLGVKRAALRLGDGLLSRDELSELSAAALLHDIAKEMPLEELHSLVRREFPAIPEVELIPAVLHSYAAPVVIKRDFPEFATEKILSATYSHTLGRPEMTLFDKIIFIADYVEDGRAWHACRALSEKLFSGYNTLDSDGKIKRINEAILESIDNTIISLRERGARCSEQMLLTRASILTEI